MSPAKGSPLASCDDPFSHNPTGASISQLPVLALETIAVAPERLLLSCFPLPWSMERKEKERRSGSLRYENNSLSGLKSSIVVMLNVLPGLGICDLRSC